jgi:hypothetical protein
MYNTGKVLIFLLVFVLFVVFPFLYGAAQEGDGTPPKIDPLTNDKACVESVEFMRAWHMDMLNEWRDEVVREASRDYVSSDNTPYKKSLTLTCMKCHKDEEKFCGECHNYVGVEPYCWDCHIDPKKE